MASARILLLDQLRDLDAWPRYQEYNRTQWESRTQLIEKQTEKLRLLLRAASTAPHYRPLLGSSLEDGRLERDPRALLASLPILTRATVRTEAASFFTAKSRRRGEARSKATGGSTGEPLRYALSPAAQSAQWAQLWRAWTVGGYEPGGPLGIVAGRSLLAGSGLRRRIYAWLQNWTTLDAFALDETSMARFASTLRARRVRHLYGYASALDTFARFATRGGAAKPPALTAIFTTAEQLLPSTRRAIEQGLGAPVFDTYGANDGGIAAFECEAHDGLHLGMERCLVEIVRADGSPAEAGEVGRILATDLDNDVFPFLRYEVGDLGALTSEACPCGRKLDRLTRLSGRLSDVVVLPDGRQVHGELFSHLLRGREAVRRFQAIQAAPTAVELRLDWAGELSDGERMRLREELAALLPGIRIEVRVTDSFKRTPAGKVPLVVALESREPRS